MSPWHRIVVWIAVLGAQSAASAFGADGRIEPIRGCLILCGGPANEEARTTFLEQAGGDKAKIVVLAPGKPKEGEDPWKEAEARSLDWIEIASREAADDGEKAKKVDEAQGVWLVDEGGDLLDRLPGSAVHQAVERLLKRGGVVGAEDQAVRLVGQAVARSAAPQPKFVEGLGLLPQGVVEPQWLRENRASHLLAAVAARPELVGWGIDADTALKVEGRRLTVLGSSYVSICLAAAGPRPVRVETLKAGDLGDLLSWRRGAMLRSGAQFPPEHSRIPDVGPGTLVIGGGGGMPAEVLARFLKTAGGPDGLIVVLPAALGDVIPDDPGEVRMLRKAGAKNVAVLHPKSAADFRDPEFLTPLGKAQGLWFTGGRQWRFVDAWDGTPAVEMFHDVLRRGGVVGGSSAGASIQSEYMVRGNPLGNTDMMAEGYERGFGFLPGSAVDQHFTQRKRFGDLQRVAATHPQLMCLGVDESTAAVVQGSTLEVMGRGSVFLYDRALKRSLDDPFLKLGPGERFDLRGKTKLETATPVGVGK